LAEKKCLVFLKKFEDKILKDENRPHDDYSILNLPDTPENRKKLVEKLELFESFKKS